MVDNKADKRKRRFRLRNIIIFFVVLVCFGGAYYILMGPSTAEVEARARKAGILYLGEDMKKRYEPLPAIEDNALPALQEFFDNWVGWYSFFRENRGNYSFKYNKGYVPYGKDDFPEPENIVTGLTEEERANLIYFVEKKDDYINELVRIIRSKGSYYSPEWHDEICSMDGLSEIKSTVQILNLKALYCIETGDRDEAINLIADIHKLAGYSRSRRNAIGELVAISVRAFAQRVSLALIERGLTLAQINKLAEVIPDYGEEISVVNMLTLEVGEYNEVGFVVVGPHSKPDKLKFVKESRFVRQYQKINMLEKKIAFKQEIMKGGKSIDNFSGRYDEYIQEIERAGTNGFWWKIFHQDEFMQYRSDCNCMKMLLRTENVSRIVRIALAEERYWLSEGEYCYDLRQLKGLYPELETGDLFNSNLGFNLERIEDRNGEGYLLWSKDYDLDYDEEDPLLTAKWRQGSYWKNHGRYVLKIVEKEELIRICFLADQLPVKGCDGSGGDELLEELLSGAAVEIGAKSRGGVADYGRVRAVMEKLVEKGYADEVLPLGRKIIEAGCKQSDVPGFGRKIDKTGEQVKGCVSVAVRALEQSSLSEVERYIRAVDWARSGNINSEEIKPLKEYMESRDSKESWSITADKLLEEMADKDFSNINDGMVRIGDREYYTNWIVHALKEAGRTDEMIEFCRREAEIMGDSYRLIERLIEVERIDEAVEYISPAIRAIDEDNWYSSGDLITLHWFYLTDQGSSRDMARFDAADIAFGGIVAGSDKDYIEELGVWDEARKCIIGYWVTGVLPWEDELWPLGMPEKYWVEVDRDLDEADFPLYDRLIDFYLWEDNTKELFFWYKQAKENKHSIELRDKVLDRVLYKVAGQKEDPLLAAMAKMDTASRLIKRKQYFWESGAKNNVYEARQLLLENDMEEQWKDMYDEFMDRYKDESGFVESLKKRMEERGS